MNQAILSELMLHIKLTDAPWWTDYIPTMLSIFFCVLTMCLLFFYC